MTLIIDTETLSVNLSPSCDESHHSMEEGCTVLKHDYLPNQESLSQSGISV